MRRLLAVAALVLGLAGIGGTATAAPTAPERAAAAAPAPERPIAPRQYIQAQANCSSGWVALITVYTYGDTAVRATSINSGRSQLWILRAAYSPISPKVYQTIVTPYEDAIFEVNAPQIYSIHPGCKKL